MLRLGLGTMRSGSNTSFSPRPSQAGQAPWGALKEKRRGSISAMVKPETGQANFSEKTMRLAGMDAPLSAPEALSPMGRGVGEGESGSSGVGVVFLRAP